METKRQMDVLDRRLADQLSISRGDDYSHRRHGGVALVWRVWRSAAWYNDSADFLSRCRTTSTFSAGQKQIDGRPAVKRGRMVNRAFGDPAEPAARTPRRQRFRPSNTQDKLQDAE